MSWIHKSSTPSTRSMRSASLSTTEKIMTTINRSSKFSNTSSSTQSSTASVESSTTSVESSTSEKSSGTPQTMAVQKLYLLLPNHKCPNKKNCPFHPPEEEEEELDEAEVTLVNKRRAMSLASHEDRMISEQLLSEKLAKINQQISSNLLEGNKLHLPRKTSHDITLPAADLERLRYDHSNTPATSSTREESVASDYDLDSGVTFDSCSDRELDDETLPLIQEEIVVPDFAEFKLHAETQQQTTSTETETTIEINETSTVDSGTFTYQTASSPDETESSATVTIHEQLPEVHSKPLFVKELEYLTVTEGSLVRLECTVIGDPRPNIKWFKNNSRIDSNEEYKLQRSEDGTVALTIEGAELEHSGSYTCVADNVAGSATTQSKIRVQKAAEEAPESYVYQRPEDREVKKHQLLAAPEFTGKLKNKMAEEGATVHLNCSVTGIPEPTCRWLKNRKQISDGSDFILRNNGGLLSLEIPSAKQSLAGEYTVEASNSEGIISCSCILQIEGDKEIEPLELDILRPKFVSKIQDVYVREGEDATFTCTAIGKPVPDFKWHRDMINITASDSVVIDSNSQGCAQLTLKKVTPSDYGLYYCVAQSKSGRAKCSAYLHVTEKLPPPVRIKEEEFVRMQARKESSIERSSNLGSPPSLVIMLPDTLDIVVGDSLKLDASVQGYPKPLVTWHKGDRGLMYSQRHRIVPCGSLHTMEIPQVMALDKGEYIVRATNVYGTVQTSCYVNILPKGSKVAAPDYTREAMIVAVKHNLIAPYFVKHLPKSIDALLGMNVRLDCILREGIELIKRSKSESPFQDLEKDRKDLVDEGFHGEFIPLEARSRDKSSSHSEDKKLSDDVIKKPSNQEEIKLEPISFTTTLRDLVQPAGSDAKFECSTGGVAEPEVQWYKDGKLLTANNRVKMATVGNQHTLKITEIHSLDEGVYTCKLNHLTEEQSCRAALTVIGEVLESRPSKTEPIKQEQKPPTDEKTQEQPAIQEKEEKPEKYEPPSLRQPLPKATPAKYGDTVELVCQLTSPDVTSVKWELDDKELPQEARYLVSSDESSNQHKLTIHTVTEHDSAKYTCVVCLKNGDLIHTSTKLNVSAAKPKPIQKNEILKPHFTTKLKDAVVKDGESLTLECDIEGDPRPQILWLRDGLEVFDSPDFQISTIGSHCKLQVTEIYPEDEGNYSCRAVNTLGEVVSTCFVSVEEKSRSRGGDKREEQGETKKSKEEEKPESPPELVVKPRRQFIDEGGKAKFKSSFDGSKNTTIFWSKNGQVLEQGENILMYEADGFHFLEVKKVSAEDCGMYSVTVQNSAGSDTAEAELEVFEKPKLLTRIGPEWEQPLQNLTVEENDTDVTLSCTCKELTQPSARWFHDGKEVFSGFHMKLQHVAQTATLTIKAMQEKDVGEYKCVMTGKNGELETSCILAIRNPEIMEPPIFVKELHDMEVDEGDKLELDVEVKGTSLVSVSWYHNTLEIMHDNPQYVITSLGNVHTLNLLHATSESSGEYVCEVHNDTGSADTYCFIEVREVKHPEPPSFVVHPTSLTAHEGETATFSCQVKGQPMPNVLWKKGGVTIATNQKFKITRIHDCHTLAIYNMSYTDEGEYVCYLHNTLGDMSYTCKLHVATDEDYSWQHQTADLKNSRPSQLEHTHQTSQFDGKNASSGENQLFSPDIVRDFKKQGMLYVGGENKTVEVLTSRTSRRTLFDSTNEPAATPVQHTAIPHQMSVESRQSNLNHDHQLINDSMNLSPKQDHEKRVKVTTDKTQNSFHSQSGFSSNSPESTSIFQFPANKIPHKVEETKSVANCGITDFRSVLKSRQVSPLAQLANSQSNDFRTVLSQNKTQELKGNNSAAETSKEAKASSELHNLSVIQSSKLILSNRIGSPSVTDNVTSSWPSPLYSSDHENEGQMLKDHIHVNKDATTNNFKQTSIQQTVDSSRNADVVSASSAESSKIVRQSWRRGNDLSLSSTSQHFEKVPGVQGLNIDSDRLSMKNFTKESEPINVLVQNNNLAGSFGISDAFNVRDGTGSSNMEQEDSKSLNKTGNTSSRNGVEAVDLKAHSRRENVDSKFVSTQHDRVTSNGQQTTFHAQSFPDSHRIREKDNPSFESEKLILKHAPLKMTLSKLSASKVSFSEFNPSEPQSDALRLEVTSVSASVPLRQSLSSQQFHPQPYSLPGTDQSVHYSDTKLEDNNNVFTDNLPEGVSSYQELKLNSKPENVNHKLRSFGSSFTWEKTPGDETDAIKDTLSKSSDQDSIKQNKGTIEIQSKRSRTRFSENLPYYKDNSHQGEDGITNRSSSSSRNKTSSCSDTPVQESNLSPKVTVNVVDDFRNVKLKSAVQMSKDKYDLAKSKFMSKSTESIFTDIKLKPVSKSNDSSKKSEISSNAERIRASSKSSDLSKLFSTSSSSSFSKYNPTSKTATTPAYTTPKFSDCVKTFSSDSKSKSVQQNSKYQKSTQSSKFRTSSGKYEKALPGGVARTNSYRKSKGIGAKFEAAIKDLKTSNEQVPFTSIHITRNSPTDVKTTRPQNFTRYSSGRSSENTQHLKTAETTSTQNGLKKNVNVVSKSNPSNAALDSNSENYHNKATDWVTKRQSLQTDSFPTFPSNRKTFGDAKRLSTSVADVSRMLEGDRQTMETNGLNKASRISALNSSRDEQHIKADWSNRKFAKDTEFRIRARSKRSNLQDSNGIEWPPHDNMKTEGNQGITNLKINRDVKNAYNDQETVTNSHDSTKLNSDDDYSRSNINSFQRKNNIGTLLGEPPKQSRFCDTEKLDYNEESVPGLASATPKLASDGDRKSEIFKTVVTMKQTNEVQGSASSIIVTKSMTGPPVPSVLPSAEAGHAETSTATARNVEPISAATSPISIFSPQTVPGAQILPTSLKRLGVTDHHLKEPKAENVAHISDVLRDFKQTSEMISTEESIHNESPAAQGLLESETENEQSHLGNTRSTWLKKRSQRQITVYPVNDTDISPYKESLKLYTDDSESVLSMASISSSSSEASNATVDSGYTRNHLRRLVGNENNHIVPETLHPENIESWNTKSWPREINKIEFPDTKTGIYEPSKVKQNTDGPNRQDNITEENMNLTTNRKYRTRRHRDESVDEITANPDSLKDLRIERQHRSQWRNPSQAHTLDSASVLKYSDTISNVKENELTNITTDSSVPTYVPRRQRRQFENIVTASSDSDDKAEAGKTIRESSSKSYISEVSTSQAAPSESGNKDISLLNENIPAELHFSKTGSKDLRQNFAMRNAKSDGAVSQSKMSIELDRPISKFGFDNIKHETDTYITNTGTPEPVVPKEGILTNFSSQEKETTPTAKMRSNFRDKGSEDYSTGNDTEGSQDRPVSKGVTDNDPSQNQRIFYGKDSHQNQRSNDQYRKHSQDKTAMFSTVDHQDEIRLSKSQVGLQTLPATSTTPSSTLLTTTILPVEVTPTSSVEPDVLQTEKELHNCPPSFPVPLLDASVTFGTKTVLQCQVTGNPKPEVKWWLNLKKVEPSQGIEITYGDEIARLTITEMSSEHAGDYTCLAKNSLGTVSSHCTLSLDDCHSPVVTDNIIPPQITEAVTKMNAGKLPVCLPNSPGTEQATAAVSADLVPDPPMGRPLVCVQERNSASVSWTVPSSIEEGQVIYYTIEAKTREEKSWDVVIPHCKELYCHIQSLKPSTTYQFRVRAVNRHGVSPPSEPSEEIIISDPSIPISDQGFEGEFPFSPRDVIINTKDKFEDLYEVDKEVGRGKFGVVYKCKHKIDSTVWAAKVIKCREKDKIGLRREIEIMNRLRHPKLLLLWDAFETSRQMVMVMEYISAGELFERVIADDFVLTENDCIHFMRQICEGVGYMHSNNIIHLDLKPENILCVAENSNRIKIIDFGLAQFHKPGQSTRVLFGTPEFMAPEVINYDEISFQTDMWSLGVICYVLLSGLSPFLGDKESETLANVTEGEYDFDDEAFEEISDLAKDFIGQLLVKRKEKRLLTSQCLAHAWLNQDEVDGTLTKRLNTEKLKKFMVRQKWLKTANAVKAVGRLLKTNSLSGFGSFDQSTSSDSGPDTPSYNRTISILQRTEEVICDVEDEDEPNIVNDQITPDTFKTLGNVPQNSQEASSRSKEENLSARNQSSPSKVNTASILKGTVQNETLTISSDKHNVHSLPEVTSREDMEFISRGPETNNSIINKSSRSLVSGVTDQNQNVGKTSASSLSTPAISRHSDVLMSSVPTKEKGSPQLNNRRTEDTNFQRQSGGEDTLVQAPCFTKSMTRCKTCAGDVARFDVVVAGNPAPRVTWLLEGEEIHPGTRHTLNSNENSRSFSLTIRSVEEDDEGEYTCKAVNSQGECICVAELAVLLL